ncbi:MAG: hypothetical protein J0L84_13300, partial [Verrucomicrobia bacterium]|nr:hypothetical protein [Verrucomicrobiota bacterium]
MNATLRHPDRRNLPLLVTLVAILHLIPARAALISHEGFDYPAETPVLGRNGGTGWQAAWGTGGTVVAPGLVWPGLVTAANTLQNAGTQVGSQRLFTSAGFDALRTGGRFGAEGTELWLSFLIRREMLFPTGSFGGVSLLDGNTQELFVGIPTGATHWSFQLFDLGGAPGNLTPAPGAPIVPGETTLLTLRLRFGVNGAEDQVDLFVNPPIGGFPGVPAASRAGADIRFNGFRVQAGPFVANSTGAIRVDEIRLGETYADVTPFVPGPSLVWLRPGTQRVAAGAAITLPLICSWPDGDPSTLAPVVTAADGNLLPPDRIQITGTGANRRVTLRPPEGPGGATTITATLTPQGGNPVSTSFELLVGPTPPEGLLAHDPFDYQPRATAIAGKAGGQGFAGGWVAGIPGTLSGGGMVAGSSNLVHAGLSITGVRMRTSGPGAQAIQRPLTFPLGDEGTVRYVSLLLRPDTQVTTTAYFGLLLLGDQAVNLFAGKPGGGQSLRYVIEDAGGARQVASGSPVVRDATSLLVLKLEFRDGPDRVSLYVNPPLTGTEPGAADAVKQDLDLGAVSAVALNGSSLWSADELRVGTTFASVTPASGPEREFALAPVAPQAGREQQTVALRLTTVAPLPEGRTLTFGFVGDAHGAGLDPVTGDFTWSPGELDGGLTHTFTVRATSNATPPESDEVTFTVQVTEANTPPELADPGSLLVEEGAVLSLPLAATDPDIPAQPLAFAMITGPDGLAVSESGLLTWTPAPAQLDQVYDVTVEVHDGFGGRARRSFNIVTRSTGGGSGPPPPLVALRADDAVALEWENVAGAFTLQATDDLAAGPWRELTVSPTLLGGRNRVLRPLTHAQEFFRLVGAGVAGRLTGAVPEPGGLAPGTTRFVTLTFSDAPGTGDVLEVTESTAGLVHTRRIPAEFLRQSDGTLGFFLNGDDTPLGMPRVTVRLVSATGTPRGVAHFDIPNQYPGSGGEPPQLGFTVWGPPAGAARRPADSRNTVRPPLFLGLTDPDGDLARLELAFTDPAGAVTHRLVPVTQTDAEPLSLFLYPLVFGSDSKTGAWTVQVTAFDRAGHAAEPRSATLNFGDAVPGNAVMGPQLVSVQPASGAPGDLVELLVFNVPDLAPTNARVRFGSRPATVVEAAGNRLRVLVPTGTSGGRVEVSTAQGSSVAPVPFAVLAAPGIEPATAHAVAGQILPFRLDRPLGAGAVIAWAVEGGGSVDADGLFRAPDHLAQAGEVTLTATVTWPGGSHTATARITVEAAPVTRGAGPVAAVAGGTVWSENLLARLVVPAGALAADTTVSVAVPSQEARPAAPAGFELIGLVTLGPEDAQLAGPVEVHIPLMRSLPSGETLPLRRWDAAAGVWQDDGVTAMVEPGGQTARADVDRLGVLALMTPTPAAAAAQSTGSLAGTAGQPSRQNSGAPRVTAVTPVALDEGELRPILLEGSNLDGPVRVDLVTDDGLPASGFVLGPLVRAQIGPGVEDGARAAFLLDGPVLPALGEGQTLSLRIRLRKAGHPDLFVPLTLRGLPEFDPADLVGPLPPDRVFSRLYSRVEIRTSLQSAWDVTDLRATREFRVLADLDVSGANGRNGVGTASGPGTEPRRLRTGAGGGTPRGGDAVFLALYEMPARHLRVGHGGVPGTRLDDLGALLSVAGCLGADARACFEEILEELREDPFDELDEAPDDLLELIASLPDGRRGASGIWNGAPTHWFRIPSGAVSDNFRWARRFGPSSGGGGGGQSGSLFGERLGGERVGEPLERVEQGAAGLVEHMDRAAPQTADVDAAE